MLAVAATLMHSTPSSHARKSNLLTHSAMKPKQISMMMPATSNLVMIVKVSYYASDHFEDYNIIITGNRDINSSVVNTTNIMETWWM